MCCCAVRGEVSRKEGGRQRFEHPPPFVTPLPSVACDMACSRLLLLLLTLALKTGATRVLALDYCCCSY